MKTVIHIFGYGEAQIISEKVNFKTDTNKFTKLKAVVDNIKSKKPQGVNEAEYHVINIMCDSRVDYISRMEGNATSEGENKNSFTIKASELDKSKLDALIAEFTVLCKK